MSDPTTEARAVEQERTRILAALTQAAWFVEQGDIYVSWDQVQAIVRGEP